MKKNIVLAKLGFVFVSGGLLNAMNKPEPLGMGATFEQEKQRLASMPQFEKIKKDIRNLADQIELNYYYNAFEPDDSTVSEPNNVTGYVSLGEKTKKLLEEADLNYNRWSDKTLTDQYGYLSSAIIKYKRRPSLKTFDELKHNIFIALNNLFRYYEPRL